jgi:hypothetical protein|tara:strand:- start:264 stop:440 length:177 start_codon:yes stop_codon:yes gene_type:complete
VLSEFPNVLEILQEWLYGMHQPLRLPLSEMARLRAIIRPSVNDTTFEENALGGEYGLK